MRPRPSRNPSLWLATSPSTDYPPLKADVEVDVAVVGGGIAGLTTAYLLAEEGRRVAVVEADRIVEGVTGYTTAKLTSLHTLTYQKLEEDADQDTARIYAAANQAAIERVADIVERRGIDCSFTRASAYTYTVDPDEAERIEAEAEAAKNAGLPAHLVRDTPLPFPVAAAVRVDDQAWFHPRRYLLALAEAVEAAGGRIFERTRALDVDTDGPCRVRTDGGTVTARDVVVASHFPFYDKAFYFARLAPWFSYLMAMRLDGPAPEGMFIDTASQHTLRRHVGVDGELLLVGGQGHKTGQGGDTTECYRRIEEWARAHFPVKEVLHRWATQDYGTPDDIPYIGPLSPSAEHVYVATGFNGWGMTTGTLAGMLLTDLIAGRDNPWAETFDPNRMDLSSLGSLAKQNMDTTREFVSGHLRSTEDEPLAPGEGAIVDGPDGKGGHFHAPDGTHYRVSAVCPHMKCVLSWNPAETTWDCSCHGSRFGVDGRVIHGPSLEDLEWKGE